MSEKSNLELEIARLEQEERASLERRRALRLLKNKQALNTAYLWVVISARIDHQDTLDNQTSAEIAGVSIEFESRVKGCVIKPHPDGMKKCSVRICTTGPEMIELCLSNGQEISFSSTEGSGRHKVTEQTQIWAFDTLEAAQKKSDSLKNKSLSWNMPKSTKA